MHERLRSHGRELQPVHQQRNVQFTTKSGGECPRGGLGAIAPARTPAETVRTLASGIATSDAAKCSSRVELSGACPRGFPGSTQQQSGPGEQGSEGECSVPWAWSSPACSCPWQVATSSSGPPSAPCPCPSPEHQQIGLMAAARTSSGIRSQAARRPLLARRVGMRFISVPGHFESSPRTGARGILGHGWPAPLRWSPSPVSRYPGVCPRDIGSPNQPCPLRHSGEGGAMPVRSAAGVA